MLYIIGRTGENVLFQRHFIFSDERENPAHTNSTHEHSSQWSISFLFGLGIQFEKDRCTQIGSSNNNVSINLFCHVLIQLKSVLL